MKIIFKSNFYLYWNLNTMKKKKETSKKEYFLIIIISISIFRNFYPQTLKIITHLSNN